MTQTIQARPFAHLSNLEREGARRIARRLLADGMEPGLVRRHMMERRGVSMLMEDLDRLRPAALAASHLAGDVPRPSLLETGAGGRAPFSGRAAACKPERAPGTFARTDGADGPEDRHWCPAAGQVSGRWSREEIASLRRLVEAGKSLRGVCEALNRSADSVAAKMRDLGLTCGRPRPAFSDMEIDLLIEGRKEGKTFAAIAAGLSRSESGLRIKYAGLKAKGLV